MNSTYPFYFKEVSDKNETIISLEDGYLKVISIGEKNEEFSRLLWQNIVNACEECDCYKILSITLSTKVISDKVKFKNLEIFNEFGINHNYKIAWVENNPDFKDRTDLFETVFTKRGLPFKTFENEEEAISWLLDN